MKNVICNDCRFLALTDPTTGKTVDASQEFRDTGLVENQVPTPLSCRQQHKKLEKLQPLPGDIETELKTPFDCPAFAPYDPTRTVAEIEELDWREANTELQRQLLALERQVEKNAESRHARNVFFGFLFVLIGAIAGIVGALVAVGKINF